ncbi:MAG TPA: hypothetical protein VMF35_10565 [Acidimicrobiales bacterium]|nr:hypothetical protein [Acidimicrobiales bacterium]
MLSVVGWDRAGRSLLTQGWVRLPEAVSPEDLERLIEARCSAWQALPEEEGVVRQGGFAAHADLGVTDASVRALAHELIDALGAVLGEAAPLPSFNEVSWTLYPTGSGHITAHRDPAAFTGVIAVATLRGSATFRVSNGRDHAEWDTAPGDVVLLGAHGWPGSPHGPVHEVDPPVDGDRLIMTLRHNSRGAGGGYDVGPTEYRRVWPPDR